LSVEETNALRAKLGLAPLEMDTKPRIDRAEAKKLEADKRAAEEQRIKLLETEERIRLAKEARMSRSFRNYTQHNRLYNETNTIFVGGANKKRKTLADSDSEDDAASWVLKSREVEQEKKLAAKREKARLEAELKAMEELEKEDVIESSAVKVVHDMDDLDEGREVIMTLKDQRILDQGDENDELENVQLAEKEKLTKVLDAKKRKNRYDKFDEDGNPKGVLSKYDDEKQKEGFVLKGTGSVELSEEAKQSHLDKIRAKLQDSAPGKVAYSLTDDAPKKEMSDTYTEEELVAFAKPKKTKKKTSKKKLRTTKSETLAALAEEAGTDELGTNSSNIERFSFRHGTNSVLLMIGSRQERERRQKEREREAMRDNAEQFKKYEKATSQANEDAKYVFEDDNDDELFASLARTREASRQKKGADDILKSVEEAAKRRQEYVVTN
jgi:U4/U6.U5 tri-snRNP-associated protein 1